MLSAEPKDKPLNSANSEPIFVTLPGPKTICKVSDSTTPKTPSIFLLLIDLLLNSL
ncbi:hypothetical protein [Clostridium sp. ZBS20]|uniref:hypothetical protein n=1 Tax=Clostridium sp. ZBS20 TaxID=2949966 RepID=UPI00207AB780|nr:hypothetical protein [Clostridium sp. ZBS20]